MKKPKISLDKDKLQQFFLLHIEKILLGIIVCLMLLLIWRGFSLPHPFGNDQTPQALVDKSNGAKQYIGDPGRWNEVSSDPERSPKFNIVAQVLEVLKPADPLAYMLVNTWSRPDFPKLSPREDPELFAPINIVVRPVIGALASYPRNESEINDPLYPSKSEEDLVKARLKKKLEEKKKKKADLAGEMPGGDGMMPGGPGARKTKKTKTTGEESTPGPRGSAMAGGMPGGYSGEYGGMGVPGGRYIESDQNGYPVQDPTNTIARYSASVTIMAVVPIQKQTEEFDKKLSNSLDYEPRRDAPWYRDYRVQRADVTDLDPTVEIPDKLWQAMPRTDAVLAEIYGNDKTPGLYAGLPTEVVDPSYLSPEVLTHPAPPYLQRDLWDLLTHPDVPLAALQPGYDVASAAGAAAAKAAGGDDDAPVGPAMGPGGMPGGMPGGEGYGGGMRGGMPGGGMPGGGTPGGGSMYSGGRGGGGMYGGVMPGGGMTGGYRRGGEESGGAYGGYGAGLATYTPPKYQLIRYTDMNVEVGHKYRYRIRVYLHDPNHPDHGFQSPSAASLHKSVRDRVAPIDEADKAKAKNQATGLPYRTWWVISPWSEPSPVAEVPRPERIYAAKVLYRAPQKVRIAGGRDVEVPLAEPGVDAVAVVFDPAKTADIPGENDKLLRGSVVNFPQDPAKVIHPVNKEVIDIPKYSIVTNAVVADMMGGEPIKSVTAQPPLTAIGEVLVMDAGGKLHVQNEAHDAEYIRRFTVPKEDKKAKAAADTAGGLDTPGPGGRPARSRD